MSLLKHELEQIILNEVKKISDLSQQLDTPITIKKISNQFEQSKYLLPFVQDFGLSYPEPSAKHWHWDVEIWRITNKKLSYMWDQQNKITNKQIKKLTNNYPEAPILYFPTKNMRHAREIAQRGFSSEELRTDGELGLGIYLYRNAKDAVEKTPRDTQDNTRTLLRCLVNAGLPLKFKGEIKTHLYGCVTDEQEPPQTYCLSGLSQILSSNIITLTDREIAHHEEQPRQAQQATQQATQQPSDAPSPQRDRFRSARVADSRSHADSREEGNKDRQEFLLDFLRSKDMADALTETGREDDLKKVNKILEQVNSLKEKLQKVKIDKDQYYEIFLLQIKELCDEFKHDRGESLLRSIQMHIKVKNIINAINRFLWIINMHWSKVKFHQFWHLQDISRLIAAAFDLSSDAVLQNQYDSKQEKEIKQKVEEEIIQQQVALTYYKTRIEYLYNCAVI